MPSPFHSRRQLIEHRSDYIEVFEWDGETAPLILAAGNGRPAAQLNRLASDLAADGVRCVTFNYRGIGSSSAPIEQCTLRDYAGDVLRIADHLGVPRVHVAGKTFGNRVVRAFASEFPDRVASVTLIGAGGRIPPSEETQVLYRRWIDPTITADEWCELNAILNYAPANAHLSGAAFDLGTYPEVSAAQIEASNSTPPEDWMSGGSGPMLVLVGLDDRIAVPENGDAIARSRPKTTLVRIANCGHNMVDEQPATLRREISAFIKQHDSNCPNIE